MTNLHNSAPEVWKEVKGFEGRFYISSLGRLKSLVHGNFRILQPCCNEDGYKITFLRKKPLAKKARIHILVAEHFIEKSLSDEMLTVNHKDGNKLNNHADNLEWLTNRENVAHAVRTGLHNQRGEFHAQAKIKNKDIPEIRSLYPSMTYEKIADRYNVSTRAIRNIISGVSWKHVS